VASPGPSRAVFEPICYKVITDKSSLLNQILEKSSLPGDKPVAVGVERAYTSVSASSDHSNPPEGKRGKRGGKRASSSWRFKRQAWTTWGKNMRG
jgi:hypothetical protein